MSDVVVTIHDASGSVVNYRQGSSGVWAPLNTAPNAMQVSTATQFQINGATYKFTKGSWTKGAYYNLLPAVNTTVKFQDQNKPTQFVQYNQ